MNNHLLDLATPDQPPFWFRQPIFVLLIVAWVALNIWSAVAVAHGLEMSGNFASMPEGSVYVLAFVLQITVAVAPLYLTSIWSSASLLKRVVWVPILWALVLSVIAFESIHQTLIQLKAGQGTEILNVRVRELDALRNRINTLDAQLPLLFQAKSKEYFDFAERAAKGLDGSGIARKGPIYTERMEKYDRARTQFVDIGQVALPLPLNGDFRGALADIEGRVKTVASKVTRLDDFHKVLDGTDAPSSIVGELTSLKADAQEKMKIYAAFNDVSPRSLAITETFSLPRKVWAGEPVAAHYWMAVAYGIAPFLGTLLLGTYLRHCVEWHKMGLGESAEQLAAMVRHEERKLPLKERLAALRLKSWGFAVRDKIFRGRRESGFTPEGNNAANSDFAVTAAQKAA